MTEEDMRLAFAEQGFLSPAAHRYPAMYREMAVGYFEMAEAFNIVGQSIAIRSLERQPDDYRHPVVLASVLLLRTMQTFQGAVTLCERGMATEARMLIRSCYENAFCLAALIQDASKLTAAFESDHKHTLKALSKFISQSEERMQHLEPKARKAINVTASTADAQWGKVKQLAIDEIAKESAYADAYLMYRTLSADSAHPSYRSLDTFFLDHGDERWCLAPGPQSADLVADTITYACLALSAALVAYTQFVDDNDGNLEVAGLLNHFEKAMDYIRAQQAASDPSAS